MNTLLSSWRGFSPALVLVLAAVSGCAAKPIAGDGAAPTADTAPAPLVSRKPTFRISGGPQAPWTWPDSRRRNWRR